MLWRLCRGIGVKRWFRVVLNDQLDFLRNIISVFSGCQKQRHINPGRRAGRGNHLALADYPLQGRGCAEIFKCLLY